MDKFKRAFIRLVRAVAAQGISAVIAAVAANYVTFVKSAIEGNEVMAGLVIMVLGAVIQAIDKLWRDSKLSKAGAK